ncbi:MAG TPA: DUF3352 domain-containing protein, partial [Candidatus Limnocylindria bacterium]|nr:DUF3352 domain-containing protein [Candidatus Limnocylindria bacterium]
MIVEHGYRERTAQPAVGRLRWVIIGAVVLLAVAIGVVLGGVLVDGTRTATLTRSSEYVPASAVMYAEARLDLPGTQRANLRALLERFPAADPDAILGEALATTLDDALADADAPFDYSHDVAPWFDGTAGVAILDYPLNVDPSEVQLPSAVGLFGVRDPEAALGLAEDLRAEIEAEGATFTSSEHAGVTIWTLDLEQTETPMPVEGEGFAYAVADDQLLLSNGDAAIRAALDAEAGESLAEAEGVADLLDALPDERAGTFVVSTAAMMAGMRAELEAAQPGLADALAGYLDAVPPVMVGSVSFAPDAFLADSATALPANESLQPVNSERGLAARVPADAIFFADGSKWGPYLEQAILTLKATLA